MLCSRTPSWAAAAPQRLLAAASRPVALPGGGLLTARLGFSSHGGVRPTTVQGEHQTQGGRTPMCCAPSSYMRDKASASVPGCCTADADAHVHRMPTAPGHSAPRQGQRAAAGRGDLHPPLKYSGMPAYGGPTAPRRRCGPVGPPAAGLGPSPLAAMATRALPTSAAPSSPSDIEVIHNEALIAHRRARCERPQVSAPAIPSGID